MKNLSKKSRQEIAEWLLNNKKATAIQLNSENDKSVDTGFTDILVYEDKYMKIIYSYLDIEGSDIIQNFTIYSKWWGKIKNSSFKLQKMSGDIFKGKSKDVLCGTFCISDVKKHESKTKHKIHNTNKAVDVEINDFASLVLYCQKKYGASPSYKVTEVISLSPNSWVEIEITMPNGETYFSEGASKKEAANKFAKQFKIK